MTESRSISDPAGLVADACCTETGPCQSVARDARWQGRARWAWRLAWLSMAVMLTEGVVGLWQGATVGSIALIGWGLGSLPEALGRAVGAGRVSGGGTLSGTAD